MALLQVRELRTYFFLRRGLLKAVDGVSFSVSEGETLGLVGESGSGKTITSLSILRLLPKPGRTVGGQVIFDGIDLLSLNEKDMRGYRGKGISMILQDPLTSLNPVFTIGAQIAEAIAIHQKRASRALWLKVSEMLKLVGVPSPEIRLRDFPHQFSGGMKQRVVGAICLSCQPRLLIADEPTTSLDATIQVQYLNLLAQIQREMNLGMVFITHDFGIVARMCTHVAVMYAGKIIETAGVREVFNSPHHPYTRALLGSLPKVEEKVEMLYSIRGEPPNLLGLSQGCTFLPRCLEKTDRCLNPEFPPEVSVNYGHVVRCWKYA